MKFFLLIFLVYLFAFGGSAGELVNFKDDLIGIYSTVNGQAIRFNPRKNLIEKMTSGMRVYFDDIVNTSKDSSIAIIFDNKSIFHMGENSNIKLSNNHSGLFNVVVKQGKFRFVTVGDRKFIFHMGDIFFKVGKSKFVVDVYTRDDGNRISQIAPIEKKIIMGALKGDKYTVLPGNIIVFRNSHKIDKLYIQREQWDSFKNGNNGYRFLFNIKNILLENKFKDKLAIELDGILQQDKTDELVLINNFTVGTRSHFNEIKFPLNKYYYQVKKILRYFDSHIGHGDIVLYQKLINQYVELEKKKEQTSGEIKFLKGFYSELKYLDNDQDMLQKKNEQGLIKDDYNKQTEKYFTIIESQEQIAQKILQMRQKHRLSEATRRSPAQVELELERQKELFSLEEKKKQEEIQHLKVINIEYKIQKIEILMARIRHAKFRLSNKQNILKRAPTIKEFAQVSLLDESYKKVKDERKYLVFQIKKLQNKKLIKVESLKVDLYDLRRKPANSWAEVKTIIREEDNLFGGAFNKVEDKISQEIINKSKEFRDDPEGDYMQQNRKRKKASFYKYLKSQNDRLNTNLELD